MRPEFSTDMFGMATIDTQQSLPLLEDWFNAALSASTVQEFVDVLRHCFARTLTLAIP